MFKNLALSETIWINTLRAFCAGTVWMFISFFLPSGNEIPFYFKLFTPFFMPFIYLLFFIISQLLKIFSLGGVGNILCMILAVPGDPLVYLIHQLKPEWIPVKEYQLFVFAGFISVYKDQLPKRSSERHIEERPESCPFAGDVVADKETSIMGFKYPASSVILSIDKDWNVSSNGKDYGYIDMDGNIRKGLKRDPKATLNGGTIIGRIESGSLHVKNTKIGTLS